MFTPMQLEFNLPYENRLKIFRKEFLSARTQLVFYTPSRLTVRTVSYVTDGFIPRLFVILAPIICDLTLLLFFF
jgi:hypothetical protein